MDKEEFYKIAKIIEIEIQSGKNYSQCIGMGYFTERFNDAWEQVKKLNEPAVSKCDGIERAPSVCDHPEKYRFVDRDGNLRCSSCHKVIEQTDC